jgi:hypothetical protein
MATEYDLETWIVDALRMRVVRQHWLRCAAISGTLMKQSSVTPAMCSSRGSTTCVGRLTDLGVRE